MTPTEGTLEPTDELGHVRGQRGSVCNSGVFRSHVTSGRVCVCVYVCAHVVPAALAPTVLSVLSFGCVIYRLHSRQVSQAERLDRDASIRHENTRSRRLQKKFHA